MRKLILAIATAAVVILASVVPVLSQDKVGLCHATGSESEPYVFLMLPMPAVENAHVNRDTGKLHGDEFGNHDFFADDASECVVEEPVVEEPEVVAPSPTPEVVVQTPTTEVTEVPVLLPDTAMEISS